MSAAIIDGKAVAAQVKAENSKSVAELRAVHNLIPGLAVVLIGDDPASAVYVKSKVAMCAELGIYSEKHVLPADATMSEVLALIDRLNAADNIHGILVQSPPPPQIDEDEVIARIAPGKDVDCFHALNVGKMLIGKTDGFFPCTPAGVMELLRAAGVDPAGKHAVVIGRSNIVGKPLVALLLQKCAGANATVTCVHSGTRDLAEHTRRADILIAALGRPEFVTCDMVKPGAVVIDVGINRVEDPSTPRGYRLTGDVDFAAVSEVASAITPVPGGVGPMTIAMLMRNTIKACRMLNRI